MVGVHVFDSTGAAYDASQTRDDIRDGDVLVVESEGVVGIMVAAWPTAVTLRSGAFHVLAEDAEWSAIRAFADDEPRDYGPSLKAAKLAAGAIAAA